MFAWTIGEALNFGVVVWLMSLFGENLWKISLYSSGFSIEALLTDNLIGSILTGESLVYVEPNFVGVLDSTLLLLVIAGVSS